ncbi:DNA mismatch repair protein PMS2 [Fistulifera solaris]|uniref:DNA mismatch repair protein PMS2 n=1 Tax=Fistulifera solaris TaxID=1519565 RepID=A0A1Z5KB76_FISSO|nr:DNA mismatch repair protein PMS2 [Fistulifera solaris]|eukprot:GAX23402.1 DNA mismatch repair protein PMS2 [Fistulifera solaris]
MENQGAGMIRPIASDAVHRIVAGQAVTDLASCVKELVDNALDAGSKTINVRLFNQGIDIVEVSDDGCGVPRCSRPLLALPHATHKIQSIDDLYHRATPLTLGFRGEALFCLANLSARLVIATRTADEELAQKMEFGRDGSLIVDSVVEMPRKVGTTVAVVKLFETVPVRQADMKRQIQNQRSRMMRMMEAYAIFSVGVCFNVMDIATDGNGRESRLLATTINSTRMEETITAVLGIRFMTKLSPIDIDMNSAFVSEEPTLHSEAPQPKWGVKGFVSTASPAGSSDSNRSDRCVQYYCINGRPVELPQISRLINDIWRNTFGQNKRPSCILTFTLPCHSFDVNVSPDKREVIFPAEQKLCELVQKKVSKLWASQTHGKFTQQIIDSSCSIHDAKEQIEKRPDEILGSPGRFKRRHAFSHDFTKAKLQHESEDRRLSQELHAKSHEVASPNDNVVDDQANAVSESAGESESEQSHYRHHKRQRAAGNLLDDTTPLQNTKLTTSLTNSAVTPSPASQSLPSDNDEDHSDPVNDGSKRTSAEQAGWRRIQKSFNSQSGGDMEVDIATATKRPRQSVVVDPDEKQGRLTEFGFENLGYKAVKRVSFDQLRRSHDDDAATVQQASTSVEATSLYGTRRVSGESTGSVPQSTRDNEHHDNFTLSGSKWTSRVIKSESSSAVTGSQSTLEQSFDCDSQDESKSNSPEVIWKSFPSTESVIASFQQYNTVVEERSKRLRDTIRGVAPTSTDNDNPKRPSDATTIGLSKEDLGKNMTIIGQYNMGFILAHTPDYHLWILDQHACDEKYNFERLCVETKIHEQRLMAPLPIELSPTEETCVMDNMEIFEKNGFRFQIDETKPPRHRLALTALPHSGAADGRKAVQFGKEDVVALCEVLGVDDSLSSYDAPSGCGTGADGSGMYGNNAVRRYTRFERNDSTSRIIARLPKAIAMFASRACRGSIMIGQALNETEMKRITTRLGDLEHPWQCPHGRSTIHHIGNLAQTLLDDEQRIHEYRSATGLGSGRT